MADLLYFIFVQQSAWFAAIISLVMMWAMGDHRWWAPLLGVFGQVFWMILAIYSRQWGLLATVIPYTIVHGRNSYKWWVEHAKNRLP